MTLRNEQPSAEGASEPPGAEHRRTGPRRVVGEVARTTQIDPAALSYHLLSPRDTRADDARIVEAYRCWRATWRDAFEELDRHGELYSDDFTRQDEVGAVFQDKECIALSFFRWVDLSAPMNRHDSYFRVWSEEARDQACREGSRICVSSSFTVAQGWRRSTVCSLKDVLVALIIERFLASEADAVVGTVRNNRGIDKLIYRNGFLPIVHNASLYGVDVDLGAFFRTASKRMPTSPINEQIIQALRPKVGAS
jgi:hypothetical protein